ncbi:putative non-specific serine/threonine protein kinase [Helianthus annuus]|nr:putative non-specific serine/threonine protein kinase [Helianthus annuus]
MLNLYITFYIIFFFLNHAFAITSDGLSLLSLKSAVVDSDPTALSDWTDNDTTPCHWTGVTCANISGVSDPSVVGISLTGKNLRDTFRRNSAT